MDRHEARRCWDEIIDLSCYSSKDIFFEKLFSTECSEFLYGDDPHSFPYEEELIWECKIFWEKVWLIICETWREESNGK